MDLIRIKNVEKKYKNGVTAIYDLNLAVEKGAFVFVIGGSGSGKSTLINILGGIDRCTSGNVYFRREDITKYKEKKITQYRKNNIGFIYQSFNLINELTLYENILLTSDSKTNIDEILKKVGLFDKKNSYPKKLSGGEQQRVSIARALSKNCDILFCDEPTGSLDSENSKAILLLLEKLCRIDKKTVVIVTHNNDIVKIADRVYTMKNGKIINETKNEKPLSVKDINW